MHPGVFAFIELFIILLIVVIIYNAYQGKNLQLSLHLNFVLLVVSLLKFVFLLHITYTGAPMCSVAKTIYC